jgi:glycyl-tRNA synthetase alpha chain
LGWEVWCDGMEVTQFTYFQQVGGIDCNPVSAELTYGLERLAMYVQGVDNGYDIAYNSMNRQSADFMSWGDVYHQNEVEQSGFDFEYATTEILFQHFKDAEAECQKLLATPVGRDPAHKNWRHVLPAYEQCIKASHTFNLLDARGVISVTERQAYISRVRALSKACAEAWVESPQGRTAGAGLGGVSQ